MKIWVLHDLIWRAPLRGIDRALFGDASSFLPSYSQIPTELRLRFVSAGDLSAERSGSISTGGGTMSGTQPSPTSLYQCPVIKMSPFNFRAFAFLSAESFLQ